MEKRHKTGSRPDVDSVRLRRNPRGADPLLYFDRGFRELSPPAA